MSRTLVFQLVAALAALAAVSALVFQSSTAAFSGTTDSSGNWDAGSVTLTDTATVAFTNDQNMVPGNSDQACIAVTYDGDVNAEVKMYGSTTFTSASDLGQYLDLVIEEVTIGTGTCASPQSIDATLFSAKTLAVNTGAFTVAHTNWSNGLATSWTSVAPAANAATKTFRITVTLQDNNSAQSLNTTATFNWEAQNV